MDPDDLNQITFLKEIAPMHQLMREVSALIESHYHGAAASEYRQKTDSTPLTQADLAAHQMLEAGLTRAFPWLPVLSEESSQAVKDVRHGFSDYWLVDPLDGTKEFLNRTGEFTINVAMIRNGEPRLGFIAAPLLNRLWFGGRHLGSYVMALNTDTPEPMPIQCAMLGRNSKLVRVLSGARHKNTALQAFLSWLESRFQQVHRSNSGSALKFCQLAEGSGDVYPRFSPCCEWDTGAGQAIVEGAGGSVLRLDGEPLSYNRSDSLMSPHFLAIADPTNPLWLAYIEHHRADKL